MRLQGITPTALQIREFAGGDRGGAGWKGGSGWMEDERLLPFS